MAKFVRTEEMIMRMTCDSFGQNVEMDLEITFRHSGGKLKAYSSKLGCFLQFPRKLREYNKTYVCDARSSLNNGRSFYTAYKGTIRDENGEVVG